MTIPPNSSQLSWTTFFFYVLVMGETDYLSATSGYHISPLSKTNFLNCKPFAEGRTLKFEEYKLSTVEKYHNLLVAERYFTLILQICAITMYSPYQGSGVARVCAT